MARRMGAILTRRVFSLYIRELIGSHKFVILLRFFLMFIDESKLGSDIKYDRTCISSKFTIWGGGPDLNVFITDVAGSCDLISSLL